MVTVSTNVNSKVSEASDMIVECLSSGNKVFTFGCGGQMANAMHFAAELSGKFEKYEDPYPCVCLGTNVAELTAIVNDFGWDVTFSRLIKAQVKPYDVVVGFSISGNGEYYTKALYTALDCRAKFISVIGSDGRGFGGRNTLTIKGNHAETPNHQEEQLHIIHTLCRQVKATLKEAQHA